MDPAHLEPRFAWIVHLDEKPEKTYVEHVKVVGYVQGSRSVSDLLYRAIQGSGPLKVHRGKYFFIESQAQRELASFCSLRASNLDREAKRIKQASAAFKEKSRVAAEIYERAEALQKADARMAAE